ncbi:MAG: ATP-binding protein [Myxococcales bacterium]|nr:ATP-binding protein [Myxococcales bacterium]
MLAALEPSEHDFQEFKGSLYLADGRIIVSGFAAALSRQVSAFANGAGGRLFLGLDDHGRIDGGLPTDLKGGGTRAWLEDVIPASVDPALRAFNVYEIQPAVGPRWRSLILPGHAVYVIDIQPSEDAPHQALDHRYYLRIAGKSRPMGHVHVQDVLQRTRHPKVSLTRIDPFGQAEPDETDPRGPRTMLCFQATIANLGKNLAHHVGLELTLPRPLVNSVCRMKMLEQPGTSLTQRAGELVFFRYYPIPLFPGQDISFQRFYLAAHQGNLGRFQSEAGTTVRWRIFADDAPPRSGAVCLAKTSIVRHASAWVRHRSRPGA